MENSPDPDSKCLLTDDVQAFQVAYLRNILTTRKSLHQGCKSSSIQYSMNLFQRVGDASQMLLLAVAAPTRELRYREINAWGKACLRRAL